MRVPLGKRRKNLLPVCLQPGDGSCVVAGHVDISLGDRGLFLFMFGVRIMVVLMTAVLVSIVLAMLVVAGFANRRCRTRTSQHRQPGGA